MECLDMACQTVHLPQPNFLMTARSAEKGTTSLVK